MAESRELSMYEDRMCDHCGERIQKTEEYITTGREKKSYHEHCYSSKGMSFAPVINVNVQQDANRGKQTTISNQGTIGNIAAGDDHSGSMTSTDQSVEESALKQMQEQLDIMNKKIESLSTDKQQKRKCSTQAENSATSEQIKELKKRLNALELEKKNLQSKHTVGSGSKHSKPELTTERIRTGDMKLVQYNRDVNLHQACEEGKLDAVEYILTTGVADINCRGKLGRTPLMIAALKGQFKVVEYLISQGADLSLVDDKNNDVLLYACIRGNIDVVRSLVLNYKCHVERRGAHGAKPVMIAAWLGHKIIVDFLVSQGCDMDAIDDNKNNVFHLACAGGNIDLVKTLLDSGRYQIEGRGQHGWTGVLLAVQYGHRKTVEFLVSKGGSMTAVDDDGANILHLACYGGSLNMVKYIVSLKIFSVESRGEDGMTPVHYSAQYGHREVLDFLVSEGASMTSADDNGGNVFHHACDGGHVDMVKYLISLKVKGCDKKNKKNMTPFQLAETKGHDDIVAYNKTIKQKP